MFRSTLNVTIMFSYERHGQTNDHVPDGASHGDFPHVRCVLSKALDKTHRKRSRGVHFQKVEKKYTLQSESGPLKRLATTVRIRGRGLLHLKVLGYFSLS